MDMAWPALRSLHELSRLGTIAAVAEATGYTPGAISQQLAGLERAGGRPLLVRVGRGVRLTDAGAVLAEHAERLLRSQEVARHALEAFGDEVAATIRVATFASSAATLLAPSIAAATTEHPLLRVRTLEVDVDAVAELVARGNADLAFGLDYPDAPVPQAPNVELIRVASERFRLAAPDRWNTAATIALADAADWDWILPPAETDYGRAVRAACRRAGFEPRVTHVVTDTAVSQLMVAQGLGTTPVTDMMLALAPPSGFRVVQLRDDIRRHVVLVRRTGDSERPAVQAMTSAIERSVEAALAHALPG
jgi:DNA-binding transcriptional LysR family regulator